MEDDVCDVQPQLQPLSWRVDANDAARTSSGDDHRSHRPSLNPREYFAVFPSDSYPPIGWHLFYSKNLFIYFRRRPYSQSYITRERKERAVKVYIFLCDHNHKF